jgi:hypothetical protein
MYSQAASAKGGYTLSTFSYLKLWCNFKVWQFYQRSLTLQIGNWEHCVEKHFWT